MAKPRRKAHGAGAADVIRFPRAVRLPHAPLDSMIHHCERLLQDAKSGKLQGLAYAVIYTDDLSPAGTVDHGFCCGPGTFFATSHGIRRLVHAWDAECDKTGSEPAVSPPPKGPA